MSAELPTQQSMNNENISTQLATSYNDGCRKRVHY